jgi:hypothetical protein
MRDRRRVYRSIRRKLGKDDYRKDLIEVCAWVYVDGVCV